MSLHQHRCISCGGAVPCLHDRMTDPSQDCPIARGEELALCEPCDLARLLALTTCSLCHGTGKQPIQDCPACEGTGVSVH